MSTDISREAAEILPCPFCGELPRVDHEGGVIRPRVVGLSCFNRQCAVSPFVGADRSLPEHKAWAGLVEAWNTRSDHGTAALREENASMRTMLAHGAQELRKSLEAYKERDELRAECERLRQKLNSANQQHQL